MEVSISEDAEKQLRAGNILRIAVARIGDKVLEVVVEPTWELGHSTGNDYKAGDPMYEAYAEFSTYERGPSATEHKWRGGRFPISLPKPDSL